MEQGRGGNPRRWYEEADGRYWVDQAQVERVRERTQARLTQFGIGFLLASLGGLAITLLATH